MILKSGEFIWHPDSLLEIISHYIQIADKKMIFPRFHQLTAVKQLVDSARNMGTGKNYLIQHSAGSGKTFTISWLVHQLSQIHNQQDTRVFDNVIIISDRKVIDRQLKEAVKQFEKTLGVVVWAEKSSILKEALETGKNIIVTTIQKFPFVVDEISRLNGRNFAVIIDEAHSSQGGESMTTVRRTLSYTSLENAEEEDPEEKDNETDDIRESFQPYYETTILSEGTDPNVLYEIERDILKFDIIAQPEIDRFAELWHSTTSVNKPKQIA